MIYFLFFKLFCVMSFYIVLMLWELVFVFFFVWFDYLEVICIVVRYDVIVWNRFISKCDLFISEGVK